MNRNKMSSDASNWVPLVEVVRGEIGDVQAVEAIHLGAIAVVDGDGNALYALGDISTPVHLRSTAKPFQLLPFILRRLDEKFGINEAEIALLMASHGGEVQHIERLLQIMEKLKVKESDLLCGAHAPTHEASKNALIVAGVRPSVLHNNCSGKHSAMVATAKSEGWDTQTYIDKDHPLQTEIRNLLLELSGVSAADLGIGVDGCSAATFILPLVATARLYGALAHPGSHDIRFAEPLKRLFEAGSRHPEMIGGTKRLDTMLMRCAKGTLFAKTGAEGIYAISVAPNKQFAKGLGIVVKISDGDALHRARNCVVASLLTQLGILTPQLIADDQELSQLVDGTLKNLRGLVVGQIKPVFQLG